MGHRDRMFTYNTNYELPAVAQGGDLVVAVTSSGYDITFFEDDEEVNTVEQRYSRSTAVARYGTDGGIVFARPSIDARHLYSEGGRRWAVHEVDDDLHPSWNDYAIPRQARLKGRPDMFLAIGLLGEGGTVEATRSVPGLGNGRVHNWTLPPAQPGFSTGQWLVVQRESSHFRVDLFDW